MGAVCLRTWETLDVTEAVVLKQRQLVGQRGGPHLLITGGVHGDEFEPMAAIRRLMRAVPLDRLRGRLTLVPVVNLAAYRRGHRTADDGLDLARVCPGNAAGSITHRTAHALSQLIHGADYYIDLHTGGTTYGLWPLTGYVLHPDRAILDQQRRMARAFNLPVVWGTDHRLEGRSLSVARDARVPAIYAEYFGSAQCSAEGIDAYVEGCLNVMAMLDMLDRDPPPSRVRHVIEDPRENSGHLQICHPAPREGFFESAVQLGQSVIRGELLGTVSDELGDEVTRIEAQHDGVVITLKTFSRVEQSEGLVVVLEVDRFVAQPVRL